MRGRVLGTTDGGSNKAGEVPVVETSGSCKDDIAGDEALAVVITDEDRRDEDARGDSDRTSEAG